MHFLKPMVVIIKQSFHFQEIQALLRKRKRGKNQKNSFLCAKDWSLENFVVGLILKWLQFSFFHIYVLFALRLCRFSHKRQALRHALGQEKAIKVGIVNSETLPQEAMTTSLSQTLASCTSQVTPRELV